MKKLYAFVIFVLCFNFTHHSQAQSFVGKLILGVNGSQIDGDGIGGYNRAGLVAGVGAEFPIDGRWTVQPEVFYSQRGSQSSTDEQDMQQIFTTFVMNYVDLPVVFQFYAKDNLIFHGGPAVSYLFDARYEDGAGDSGYSRDYMFKQIDVLAIIGMEYRFLDNLSIHLRANYSMMPINKIAFDNEFRLLNPNINFGGWGGMRNNFIGITLRYSLNDNYIPSEKNIDISN